MALTNPSSLSMSKRNIWFLASLVILITAFVLLITGSSLLLFPLSRSPYIPLGTLSTWLGYIALPLTIYFGVKEFRNPTIPFYSALSFVLKVLIALAILWAPICYGLAGNFSNSFTEKETFQGGQLAMQWFWRFSYGLAALPLLLLVIHWIFSLFRPR